MGGLGHEFRSVSGGEGHTALSTPLIFILILELI